MEFALVGIVWLVCAVACYLIADRKGDPSPLVWGLAGIFLGPLGLLATWLMASPRKPAS